MYGKNRRFSGKAKGIFSTKTTELANIRRPSFSNQADDALNWIARFFSKSTVVDKNEVHSGAQVHLRNNDERRLS